MILGFTGTQQGMTLKQKERLSNIFRNGKFTGFRHGGCIGADEQAHYLAIAHEVPVWVHPGVDRKGNVSRRGKFEDAICVNVEKFYLDRNKDIVNESDIMVATPHGFEEELRSGTWATIRYARSVDRRGIIIWPDGEVNSFS